MSPSSRLVSLDAMRGATIALMVLVNTAGGFEETYAPLRHAEWHGWTLTDVVFPTFVWIVGLSIAISLGRRLERGATPGSLIPGILRRGAILYALGLFLYLIPKFDLGTARLLGVLQRIAICYVVAAVIYLWTGIRAQIAIIIGLMATYWALMAFMPVPGFGVGRLDVEGNFAHYVDRMVLGAHNYRHTKTWDPEGIVSTLPAIASALIGLMAAHLLRLRRELSERTTWMFLTGNALLALGLILNVWLPINKKLWTDSFALFMAGLDFVIFAGALWLIDGRGYSRFARPFTILGMNAITIYMISELGEGLLTEVHIGGGQSLRSVLYTTLFAGWLTPVNASLFYSLSYVALMFAIAYLMYRRGLFVRV